MDGEHDGSILEVAGERQRDLDQADNMHKELRSPTWTNADGEDGEPAQGTGEGPEGRAALVIQLAIRCESSFLACLPQLLMARAVWSPLCLYILQICSSVLPISYRMWGSL